MNGEIKRRWKAETPRLFKQLIKLGIGIGVIGGTLVTFPATATIGGIMVAVGTTVSAISKLTKQ